MTSVEDLKAISEAVKKDCAEKAETASVFKRALVLYENYLTAPETCFPDLKTKAYFFEDFTSELVQCLTTLPALTKAEYKETVKSFLQTLVNVLLAELPKENRGLLQSIRPLFDPENSLYENAFGDLKNEIRQYQPPVDPEWRAGLKAGDKLDVLKEERVDLERIEGWAMATIKEVIGDELYCTFDGLSDEHVERYKRDETRIAPSGTRTRGWEWRDKLAVDDRIDIFDTQGKWFLGTVLGVDVNQSGIKTLYVGFRIYIPNGTKLDANGRKHEGWSAQYDTWIPAYSIRVQRPNFITKMGTVYCRRILDDESPAPEDSGDVLQNYPVEGDYMYVIHRFNKCYSSLYLDLMNNFGKSGGFDKIVSLAQTTTSVELLFAYLDLMSAPNKLYHRCYVKDKIMSFVEAVMEYMSHIPEEQLRCVTKEKLDVALMRTEDLMRRVYTAKTKGEMLIQLRMGVSISLLRAEQLERRIQAIRIIAETCKSAKSSQEAFFQTNLPTANDSMVLSSLLQVPQLIEEIFGKRSHIQLIQRSTDILKFVLLYSKITQEDFNVIWECCKQDEQSKVEIFKVISDSSNFLPGELIGYIIDKFVALPKSGFKNQDIEIICELGGHYAQPTAAVMRQILELMWQVVKGGITNLSPEIIEKVMIRFCDVITTPMRVPEAVMREYFDQCYQMLEKGQNSILALRVLRRSMVQLPVMARFSSRDEMLFTLLTEGGVFEKFFADIERYYTDIKSEVLKEHEHKEEVLERKEFTIFLLRFTKYKLTKDNLELLWRCMVKKAVCTDDQIVFYRFLKEVIMLGVEDHVASMEDIVNFFTTVICNEENNFKKLPVEGVQAIESLLITVNKSMEKIVEVGTIRRKRYNYSYGYMMGPVAPGANWEENKDDEIEFRVKTLPTQIVGSSVLWKIVLEADSESVTIKAIELINKIYTKLSEELDDRIAEISSNFVETAIEKLRLCYQHMTKDGSNRSSEIVKVLRLIEEMLDDSERNGNGGLTPLVSLPKGAPLTLKIHNFATDSVTDPEIPEKLELSVHSRITYWQLKVLIAKHLKSAPEILRLIIANNETKDRDNGKTLEDLKISDGDLIRAAKRSEEFVARANLIKNKAFTEKAKIVFTEVFERFSKEGKMAPADCANFTRVCLSDRYIDANDHQVQGLFKEYDKEKKGYLSLEQFLDFYEHAANDREETVWNNLKELGYGPDLNRLDMAKPIITTSVAVRDKLPRYLLANNPDYLAFLFSLVKLGGEIGSVAWHLVFRLALSEKHLEKVKTFFLKETVDWNSIFVPSEPYESMYCLFLMQSLIGDTSQKDLAELRQEISPDDRINLRSNLLKHGCIQWAIQHLKTIKETISKNEMLSYGRMVLHLITVYVVGSLNANDKLPKELKHFTYKVVKEEAKTEGSDTDKAHKGSKMSTTKSEFLAPLADQYLVCYQELCAMLVGDIGLTLLSSVDCLDLAKDVVELLDQILSIPKLTNDDGWILVAEIGTLLKALSIYKANLYENLIESHDMRGIMLKGTTYSSSVCIRDLTQQLAYFLCVNVRPENTPLAKTPLGDILSFFLDTKLLLNYKTDCECLYELLILLVDQYKPLESKGERLVNTDEKLRDVISHLQSYQSCETSYSGPIDNVLLGLLQLSAKLVTIKDYTVVLAIPDRIRLIGEVFTGCLFPKAGGEYKCKTSKSREVAYKLILSLTSYKTECWIYLMKECILPLREKVSELNIWSYVPTAHERSALGYVGLKNMGCICYINSMLQQFFMISPFRNTIVSVRDGKLPNYTEEGIDDNLLHQLQRTFVYLINSTRKDYNPATFCYSFKEADGRPTNTAIQHDAQEFLNILFERLEKALKDTPYKNLMQSVFGGKSCSQVTCSNCGYVSSTYEDYYTLSLEIKNQRTLNDSLERFITKDNISGYQCSNCRKRVDVTKRTLISTLPNVLVVHLQRFTFNFDTLLNEKIHTRLEFPNVLDMTKYTEEGNQPEPKGIKKVSFDAKEPQVENIATLQRKQSEIEEQEKEDKEKCQNKETQAKKSLKDKDYYTYKLVGIVMHNGNAEAGHYYSYINSSRQEWEDSEAYLKTENDKWVEFNDSIITEFAFSKVEAECFGGSMEDISTGYMEDNSEVARLIGGRSKSAYMLIYERKKKDPIPLKVEEKPVIADKDLVLSSLECDSTAVSRAKVNAGKVYGKDKDGDLYSFHNFHNVPCIIPTELLSEVLKDNEKFLYEKLIYGKEYLTFLCESYSSARISCDCISSPVLQNTLRPLLCTVADKFFFDIVSHAALGELFTLLYIGEAMAKLFMADLESSKQLLKKFINEPGRLFNLLVKCPEQMIRACIQKAVLAAFTKVLNSPQKEGEEPLKTPYEVVDVFMGLIGYELSTQWTKFKQFFELLRDIVLTGGDSLVQYCLEKDVVTTLLDFFLEKSSPVGTASTKRYEMGSPVQFPEFTPLLETVSFLVLHADLPTPSGEKIAPPTKEGTLPATLSASALKCIQCEELVPKFLKGGGKISLILKMMVHACFRNKKFTKRVCKMALKGVNDYEINKIPQYFELIAGLLSLEDEYQALRMEWILGYAQPYYRMEYGLAGLIDIEDDINNYVSSIGMDHKDDPLLQLLWNYRKRYEQLITQCLKMLFTVATDNLLLHNYLKNMPPPCYLYARYTDWVPRFLDYYSKATSFMTTSELKEKEVLIVEVKALHDAFQERVLKEGTAPPQLYMIGKTLKTREIKEIVVNGVKLTVSELMTEVYPSLPMGDHNAALSGDFLIRHFNHFKVNANSKFEAKAAEGAEKEEARKEPKIVVHPASTDEVKKEELNPEAPALQPQTTSAAGAQEPEVKTPPTADINSGNGQSMSFTQPVTLKPKAEQMYKPLTVMHKIEVANNGSYNGVIKVIIKPKSDSTPNFYCPTSKCRHKVTLYNSIVQVLQKIDAAAEMGEYDIELIVKDLSATEYKAPVAPPINVPQPPAIQQESGSAEIIAGGDVSCPQCTYYNSATTLFCEMCSFDLTTAPGHHSSV